MKQNGRFKLYLQDNSGTVQQQRQGVSVSVLTRSVIQCSHLWKRKTLRASESVFVLGSSGTDENIDPMEHSYDEIYTCQNLISHMDGRTTPFVWGQNCYSEPTMRISIPVDQSWNACSGVFLVFSLMYFYFTVNAFFAYNNILLFWTQWEKVVSNGNIWYHSSIRAYLLVDRIWFYDCTKGGFRLALRVNLFKCMAGLVQVQS